MGINEINDSLRQFRQLELKVLENLRRLLLYNQALKLKEEELRKQYDQWLASQEEMTNLEQNAKAEKNTIPNREHIIPEQVIRFFQKVFKSRQFPSKLEIATTSDPFGHQIDNKTDSKSEKIREVAQKILQSHDLTTDNLNNLHQLLTQKEWRGERLTLEPGDSFSDHPVNTQTASTSRKVIKSNRPSQPLSR